MVVYHFLSLTGFWKGRGIWGIDPGLAVEGFFVISGFLLTWSLQRDARIGHYALKRFFRIYPLYFCVIMAQCFLLLMRLHFDLAGHFRETLRYLACNLLFLNFLQPSMGDALSHVKANAINGSLWTLKLEVAFYFMLPPLLLAYRRFGPALLILPYLALCLIAYKANVRYAVLPEALKDLLEFRYFFVGIGFYYFGTALFRYRKQFAFLGLAAALLVMNLHFYSNAIPRSGPLALAEQTLHPLLTGLAVFCLAFAAFHIKIKNDLSYGAYVLHYPLIQLSLSYGLFARSPLALFFVSLLAAVTLLSWLSYRYIEHPAIQFARRLTRRKAA